MHARVVLLDLMGQQVVDLSKIEILVIDEADRMFDMGFLPDIRRILAALPKQRQTLLFSATMPDVIRSLADEFLNHPVKIDLGVSRPVETIGHAVYPVVQTRKAELLLALLRKSGNGQVLVFTRTKHRAKKLAEQLIKAGLPATSLQGNLSGTERQRRWTTSAPGGSRYWLPRGLATRGIDVSQISHVINFDMPDTADAYTHRIGRTGRMARQGTALTLRHPG